MVSIASICFTVSSITPTTIMMDDPPNEMFNPNTLDAMAGIMVSRVKASAPINVILFPTVVR